MLCYEGRLSVYCFFGTTLLILVLSFPELIFDFVPNQFWGAFFWGPILYYALLNMILRLVCKEYYPIAVRATFLGFIFSVSCLIYCQAPIHWKSFGIYGAIMSIFHYSEFLAVASWNPGTLSIDSFILNHSMHYAVAAVSSWIEFLIELYFYPDLKEYKFIWLIGFILCVCGEILRKLAMLTANSNFNHVVQYVRAENHELVTHGVYNYCRHPSYVGWFWWSIGTQIILFNPICIILYTLVSWKFFNDRIFLEEITLLNFFGDDYYKYQQKVPTGLPFINGYKIGLS